ncbi:uracil-DNA glycosylase family protein [Dermatophilaceae bacterium Soc4.6]
MGDVDDLERGVEVLLARWRMVAAQHPERGVVPSVDPAGGGLGARLLVLMEQPAPVTAAMGAEAVCGEDGPSSSVRFFVSCREQSGLSRTDYLRWNVIPWARAHAPDEAAPPSARRPPGRAELDDAREGLHELLTAMVELRAVVALGSVPLEALMRYFTLHPRPVLRPVLAALHPSPANGRHRREQRERIVNALRRAGELGGL